MQNPGKLRPRSQPCRIAYETPFAEVTDFGCTSDARIARVVEHKNKLRTEIDAIISVGYRVNSQKATRIRQWATTWKHALNGRILKSDVSIAKNYLSEKEIRTLERTIQ